MEQLDALSPELQCIERPEGSCERLGPLERTALLHERPRERIRPQIKVLTERVDLLEQLGGPLLEGGSRSERAEDCLLYTSDAADE